VAGLGLVKETCRDCV